MDCRSATPVRALVSLGADRRVGGFEQSGQRSNADENEGVRGRLLLRANDARGLLARL